MKYVATIAVAGLGIILLIQNLTTAGPNPSPRSVPIIVHDVMQPSRMVSVVMTDLEQGISYQVPIGLPVGKVFVLTASTESAIGSSNILRGGNPVAIIDNRQSTYPTGICFPRNANGIADMFVVPSDNFATNHFLSFHGYITDDF